MIVTAAYRENYGLIKWAPITPNAPQERIPNVAPYVISDTMPAAEHVDGRFYESKAAFRAVTRAHGLTEVGNEKIKPKTRSSLEPEFRRNRKKVLKTAIEKVRAGHYERHFNSDGSRRAGSAGADRSDDT